MYVAKYIIEQKIMLGETYLAGQKWPVTSQVVYTLFMETAANYGSVYSCFFSFNILFQKQFFCTQQFTDDYKQIENTSWKVPVYGIYVRVVDVSEIERVSAATE